MDIKRSEMLDDGVCVEFDNGWYYTHSITSLGNPSDPAGKLSTMWGWINHLHEKRWWNPQLEAKFIKEVSKYL